MKIEMEVVEPKEYKGMTFLCPFIKSDTIPDFIVPRDGFLKSLNLIKNVSK